MTPKWFRMETTATEPSVADIYIFDMIGGWIDDLWGFSGVTTAKSFLDELSKLPEAVKTLRLHINSPGGDVFSAVAIANTLRDQRASKSRTVDVLIEGLAASAASVIAMAGDTVRMADNALFMIHNPWSWVVGEAKDMRQSADELDTVRDTLISTYQWHSTLSREEIAALMDATTWMDADEAIARGFATAKVEGLKAAATLNRRGTTRLTVPDQYRAKLDALLAPADPPTPPAASATEVLSAVERAGLSTTVARELIEAGLTSDQVTARVREAVTARDAAAARATEIRSLCAVAQLPTLADGYIAGQMRVADVRAHVTTITAIKSGAEIDATVQDEPANAAASWKQAFARVTRRRAAKT